MKVTGQSSLIAAQQMGLQRTSAEAKAASAAFFAELRKSTPAASAPSAPAPTTENAPAPQINKISSMREAPMRGVQAGAPLPPGSLLNIVV
jgi:hypothetical protein